MGRSNVGWVTIQCELIGVALSAGKFSLGMPTLPTRLQTSRGFATHRCTGTVNYVASITVLYSPFSTFIIINFNKSLVQFHFFLFRFSAKPTPSHHATAQHSTPRRCITVRLIPSHPTHHETTPPYPVGHSSPAHRGVTPRPKNSRRT